ncbi:hypothetical protein JB92DRAFT_2831335 [Gautieria morchelliformis]|nr:hypothetical protein JB92DRAFT_2831335 [Gautieria morchelliformis]
MPAKLFWVQGLLCYPTMHWVSSLASLPLYEFAWAAISKRTLTTVLAAVKLEDMHRIPDPSIELSPVQIQEGPFFKPPPSPPPAGTEILSENMPRRRLLLHIKRYNGELRATPMTSLS